MRRPWPHHCIGLDVMGSKTAHNLKNYLAALSLLLATPLAAGCQQSTPTAGEVLSLDQAINIALQNNRSLKNARLNVDKGEDEIRSIRTSRLPSTHFYALVSQDMVKHETNLTSPFTGVFPGIGPFFSLSTPRRPTAVVAAQVLQPISQQYRIGLSIRQIELALLRNRLQHLRRKDCCGSSWRAQREEWSYAREDTGEWAGQVRFVFDHVLRGKRVEMCGRKTGCAYASDFIFAFVGIQARIF